MHRYFPLSSLRSSVESDVDNHRFGGVNLVSLEGQLDQLLTGSLIVV